MTFLSPPDFEAPADANGDNGYEVAVAVSDGTLTATAAALISVVDGNESPVLDVAAAASVSENSTAVIVIATATDIDSADLTYAIAGGADGNLFTIDADAGALQFSSERDFESPTDANGDNTYEVEISVMTGSFKIVRPYLCKW